MMIIYEKGQWHKGETVTLAGGAPALNFGIGLFETLYGDENGVEFYEPHINRLRRSCHSLRIPFDVDPMSILERLEDMLAAESNSPQALKMVVHSTGQSSVLVLSSRPAPYQQAVLDQGIALKITKNRVYSTNELLQHKTTNYWEFLKVREDVQKEGFFDAIRLNERNCVTEAAAGNLITINRGMVITSPVQEGLLPGVMRAQVIQSARSLGLFVEELPLTVEMVSSAEGLLYTNSLAGIVEVKHITDETGNVLREHPRSHSVNNIINQLYKAMSVTRMSGIGE